VKARRYTTTAEPVGRGRLRIPVPFDPDTAWGHKPRHHVAGTVNGLPIRGIVEADEGGHAFTLGPAWRRDCGLAAGDTVTVTISPEGPQRDDLATDFAAALQAHPDAGAFFDSLAQYYRHAYLRWIEATNRRPDQRAQRIAETIALLEAGHKQRPQAASDQHA
jgi:hypothetical protein